MTDAEQWQQLQQPTMTAEECSRCSGKGNVTYPYNVSMRCPVCHGLGEYVRQVRTPRPDPTFIAVHSDEDVYDVIARLPWAKEDDDE